MTKCRWAPVAMLSDSTHNQLVIAKEGGIPPLIALLSSDNAATQLAAARALGSLASQHAENQHALWQKEADAPLATLLGSDSLETQVMSANEC